MMSSSAGDPSQYIEELKARVGAETLERYRTETCINGVLEYKLNQLLAAASHDVPENRIVERAAHVIDQCLLLRDVLKIDTVLDDDYFPASLVSLLQTFSCMSVVGNDFRGNTVIFFNLKGFNPIEYRKIWEFGHRDIPQEFQGHPEFEDACVVNYCSLWYVRMMEWIHKYRFERYKRGEAQEPKVVMILDIESAGISTYSTELKMFLKGIKISGGYLFPEICDYIYAANVPWLAYRFWPVIKFFLHPATASKVDLYDKIKTKSTLPNMIKLSELPTDLGGEYEPETRFESPPHI